MSLHPQLQTIAEAMGSNPDQKATHELAPKEAREAYRAMAAMLGPGPDSVDVRDLSIPGPAGEIPLRLYTPQGQGPFPVLVFYHGGGWVIGDLDTHDRECREICEQAGCVVAAVQYRLAPEHRFPAAVEDAFAALKWVGSHAAEIGGDSARLAVGGDSAGGNLSAVVALLARDAGGPALRFQLLIYPAVDGRQPSPYASREKNAAGPFLLKETIDYFSAHYLSGNKAARVDPRYSPLLADSHSGLPPALVVTAEYDPLRDEGEAYARALEKAGVPVQLHRYDGMAHLFFQLGPVVDAARELLSECAKAISDSVGGK